MSGRYSLKLLAGVLAAAVLAFAVPAVSGVQSERLSGATIGDAVKILRYCIGWEILALGENSQGQADVSLLDYNGDGAITVADAVVVLRVLAGNYSDGSGEPSWWCGTSDVYEESSNGYETSQPQPGEMDIPTEWFEKGGFDSIADMVDAKSYLRGCMSFYEGDGFACMEVRDDRFTNQLFVIFEDYRTGKMMCIVHDSKDSFSTFWFWFKYSDKYGVQVIQKPLGARGNPQDFRAAATGIKPAVIDYSEYLKGDDWDNAKILAYAMDKEKLLDSLSHYYAFDFSKYQNGVIMPYSSKDKEYLSKFLDFYHDVTDRNTEPAETTRKDPQKIYELSISIQTAGTTYYGNRRNIVVEKYEDKMYLVNGGEIFSLTQDEFDWFEEWVQPLLKLTYDYQPLDLS